MMVLNGFQLLTNFLSFFLLDQNTGSYSDFNFFYKGSIMQFICATLFRANTACLQRKCIYKERIIA